MRNYIITIILATTTTMLALAVPDKPESKSLPHVVHDRAASIMHIVKTGKLALHLGRKSLLLEMQNQPGQLSLDIGRIPIIRIGGAFIPDTIRANKSPEQLFLLIAGNLEKYLKEHLPSIKNSGVSGRLGEFWTTEVIYTMAQTFLAPPVAAAYQEIDALAKGEWAAETGATKLSAEFMILAPSILEVTLKSEKSMLNLKNLKFIKPFMAETKFHFNLSSGELIFYYSYVLDNQKNSWLKQSFFTER